MQLLPKKPVSLCLHDIQDPGAGESSIVISALSVPFVHSTEPQPTPGGDNAPYLYSYKYYDNAGNYEGTTEVDSYGSEEVLGLFWVPLAQCTQPSRYYYIINASSRDIGVPISCPSLMCHSDNGNVIVAEEEAGFIDKINGGEHESHIFTNLKPNEMGCVNLKITLPTLTSNMWAIVSYYVPNVNNHFPQNIVSQRFPIHLLQEETNTKECRIGFKAFFKDAPIHTTYTTDVLPMVWVHFEEVATSISPAKSTK